MNLEKLINEDEEINSVRCLKSFLSNVSPIFAAMFNKNWEKNEVIINDPVPFNQFNCFSNFIQCIIKFDTLTCYDATSCYYYAEKYRIEHTQHNIVET